MDRTIDEDKGRAQCLNCNAIADALAHLQKEDVAGRVQPWQCQGVDIGTLDTLRQTEQCSTCASLHTAFVEMLTASLKQVVEVDYQRKVSVQSSYGRFLLGLVRSPL